MSEYVTDPALLSQLNGTTANSGYVTDPALLAQLNENKYESHPISTFLANAVNSATFGLPDYLNKKFTPETYAEGQKYQQANPVAATAGDVAGYVVPTGVGAIKGAQLGAKVATGLAERFAPKIPELAKLYGQSQGAITGATMGAQTVAAAPGVMQGDPGRAVAGPTIVNQYANSIPMINHLGGATGLAVPAVAGYAAEQVRVQQERAKQQRQAQAQAVLAQPPTAQNFIARSKAMAELYGDVGK